MREQTAHAESEAVKTVGSKSSPQPAESPPDVDEKLWDAAQSLQICLLEQDRLLAKSPDFLHKGLITNCARAALVLFEQVSRGLQNQTTIRSKSDRSLDDGGDGLTMRR